MPYNLEPPPVRLRIWQQNMNKSDRAQFDLINSLIHKDWDLVLLQEPYIDTLGNTKADSKWHTLYPSAHLTDDTTNRSVILVNTVLDTNSWTQMPFKDSNDVTIIQFRLPQGRLTILNIYNNCTHSLMLDKIRWHLTHHAAGYLASGSDRMLWCSDFNCHHPLWDKERNRHLFTASASSAVQPLISLLEDYNKIMLLPKNMPTLQSMSMGNWTRVDNIFATSNMEELVVVCDMDPRLWGLGTDHVPILTTLEYAVPARGVEEYHNFRAVDWDSFCEELAKQLCYILEPCALFTDAQFQKAVANLTGAIQATIGATVPTAQPAPHLRRWWNNNLSRLKKDMNCLGNLSYRYRAVPDHPSHGLYHNTRCSYGDKIK